MGHPTHTSGYSKFYHNLLRYAQTGIDPIEAQVKTYREAHDYRCAWNSFKSCLRREVKDVFLELKRAKTPGEREQLQKKGELMAEEARRAGPWYIALRTPRGRASIVKKEGETPETGPCTITFIRKGEKEEEKRITMEFEEQIFQKLGEIPGSFGPRGPDFLPPFPEDTSPLDIDDLFNDMDTNEKPRGRKL